MSEQVQVLATRRLSRVQRLPWRRIAQIVVGAVALVLAVLGAWKTIALGQVSGGAWLDLARNGIALGAIYGLIAIGYTLVYGVLRLVNFAHGEVVMAGAFGSYFVARLLDDNGMMARSPILSLVIVLLVACAVSIGIAMLLERVAYRPLRGSPRLVPLITAIGASLFLQNTARGFFGDRARGYPRPELLEGTWRIFGEAVERTQVLVIVVTIVAMVALTLYVSRTRAGRAMRAVSLDRETAALMGIDVDRIIVRTFVLGGLMAGVAAMLFCQLYQVVDPIMGFSLGIKAFSAAVLGGIGSIGGAALGGLLLGGLESVGPTLFLTGYRIPGPNQMKDVIAFLILVLVLILRPGGILGSDDPEKL